jgi:ABC-type dipeptide/oligopeptide/nickel transport system ATPase component
VSAIVLEARDFGVSVPGPEGAISLLRRAAFRLVAGEFAVLVGESGSGKSTLLRALAGILPPGARTSGSLRYRDSRGREQELPDLHERELRALRRSEILVVPHAGEAPLDPLRPLGRTARAAGALDRMALVERMRRLGLQDGAALLSRIPGQLSGGEQERVLLAVAAGRPSRILAVDEPTTGLDWRERQAVAELLVELARTGGRSVLAVTHDLALAGVADRLLVLLEGCVIEACEGPEPARRLSHPYAQALLRLEEGPRCAGEAWPRLGPRPATPPPGCPFSDRCPRVREDCRLGLPPLAQVEEGHLLACPVVLEDRRGLRP